MFKMKIAIIHHVYLDRDLSKTSQLSTLDSLNKQRYPTRLIVPSSKIFSKKEKNIIKIPTFCKHSLISGPIFNLFLLLYMPFYLLMEKPDFVLSEYMSSIGLIPYIILSKFKLIKTKFVFTVLSPPVTDDTFIDKLRIYQYLFSLKLYNLYSGLIFLTNNMGIEECRKYKIKIKHFGIWNSGVDENKFDPKKYKSYKNKHRKQFSLEDKFIIIYHGIFNPHRGLRRMITSFSNIIKKNPRIVLFLLGDGPIKDDLNEIIKNNNLQKNVILFGPVDHNKVPEYITMANIGIIPLPHHKFWNTQSPLKLLEYLSMEKPIILTNIPAHKEVTDYNHCAFYIKHPNEEEFSRAIKKVFLHEKQLISLGKSGRNIILKKYTWKNITKNLIKFLEKISNNDPKK